MRDRRDHRLRDERLVRHLHGELPPAEAQELRRDLARDPRLAARLGELERLWQGLELPPVAAPPPGYAARLARLAAAPPGTAGLWGLGAAPPWAKALVAASLATGLVLGLGLGGRLDEPTPAAAGRRAAAAEEPRVERAAGAAPAGAPGPGAPGDDGTPAALASGQADDAAPPASGEAPQAEESESTVPVERVAAAPAVPADEVYAAADGAAESTAADVLLGDAGSSFGGGTTLAEAYWQAFGAGEAGW